MRRNKKRTRRSAILIVTIIFLLAVGLGQLFKPGITATAASEPVQIVTVIVDRGDSLWKIAERHDNNKIDLRKYIDIIQKYNGLENTVLQPGQRIKVPVYAMNI